MAGVALAISILVPAQGPGVLTLPEAMRRVARTSVQAETARFDAASAREDTVQVSALYTPQVTLEGGHLNLDNRPAFINGPIVFPAAEPQSWHYKLDVRYLIWDGGRRAAARAGTVDRVREIELRGSERVRRVQAEVAARYAEIFIVKAQKGVVAQRRDSLSEHLRTVQDLFDQGVVARNDLLRTEVALRSVGDADRALDDSYASALEALNVAMGMDSATPQAFPDSIPPAPPVPWDEAHCREMGAASNGSVLALEAKVKVLEDQILMRRRDYLPSLVAEVASAYDQNQYMLYPYVNSLFIGFSVNVFDGGTRASKIRQASLDLDKVRRELKEARSNAEASASQALREFRQALREAETALANVASSEENLRIVEDQYREGIARNADVLDAEQVLAESRFSLAQKNLLAYARQASLLMALGQDLPSFYSFLDVQQRPQSEN
jgi:outer membrane protein